MGKPVERLPGFRWKTKDYIKIAQFLEAECRSAPVLDSERHFYLFVAAKIIRAVAKLR